MSELSSLLPLAVGMAISPLPIVAVVAILLSARGRTAPTSGMPFGIVTKRFTSPRRRETTRPSATIRAVLTKS